MYRRARRLPPRMIMPAFRSCTFLTCGTAYRSRCATRIRPSSRWMTSRQYRACIPSPPKISRHFPASKYFLPALREFTAPCGSLTLTANARNPCRASTWSPDGLILLPDSPPGVTPPVQSQDFLSPAIKATPSRGPMMLWENRYHDGDRTKRSWRVRLTSPVCNSRMAAAHNTNSRWKLWTRSDRTVLGHIHRIRSRPPDHSCRSRSQFHQAPMCSKTFS